MQQLPQNADPGEAMGFPAESFCMSCHRTVKTGSPDIQKLAAAAKAKEPSWVRVYRLPTYVCFSHRVRPPEPPAKPATALCPSAT